MKGAIVMLAALLAGGAAVADTVNGVAVSGSASLTVLTPLSVVQVRGLDFGAVTSGAAGNVAIDPASGARTLDGGVGAAAANPGAAAQFTITGRPNAAINVVVGPTITGLAGGITGATRAGVLPTLLNGTTAAVFVGGSLAIPAHTPAGQYVGVFTVAVNYP